MTELKIETCWRCGTPYSPHKCVDMRTRQQRLDEFARAALIGLMPIVSGDLRRAPEEWALDAYEVAEAMLAESERRAAK